MRFTFARNECLKSKILIQQLFTVGKAKNYFPIRMVWLPSTNEITQYSVSVAKKRFARAVDRNHIKRLMREAIRLNKSILNDSPPMAIMFIYIGKEILPQSEVELGIKKGLIALVKAQDLTPKST